MESRLFLLVGFIIFVIQEDQSKGIDCGSHYTSRTGSFSSPGHPNNYSSNLFCVWTVWVSGNNPEIKLTFSQFNLPEAVDGECSDFVAVYSGSAPTKNKLIGKYCGSETPSPVLVKELSVYVQFVSNDDDITTSGFVISFSTSSSRSSITTSQATAGIVAAIFCGIVFLGVASMRCVMMGACQRCHSSEQQNRQRECIGTNETVSNYVMDCPPSYRTVMEHPERFPTPDITPHISPTSTPRVSHYIEPNESEDDEEEPPPPYSRVIPSNEAMDLDLNTARTSGNDSDGRLNVERTLPANNNNVIGEVTVHNNPISIEDEREVEQNSRNISENEISEGTTTANRRRSYCVAACEHPVSSMDSTEMQSSEDSTDQRNICGRGSLSTLDCNDEIVDNSSGELQDTVDFRVQKDETQRNGCVSADNFSLTHDHSTQTEEAIRGHRSGHSEVWL